MKPIIVAVDFSGSSANAANYAADLAAALQAELVLMNAVRVPLVAADVQMPEYVFEEMLESANQGLEEMKDRLSERIMKKVPIVTETTIGAVEEQLEEMVSARAPLAIVMGLKKAGSMERFLMGSNTLFTIRHLHCPVLIVPDNASFKGAGKIGIACDLTDVNSLPFESIKEWLLAFDVKPDIIHIGRNTADIDAAAVSESVSLHNRLNQFHPQFHFLQSETPGEGLADAAQQLQLDLLMVFPKKHGFWELFDQKHIRAIISQQQIPVLAIPL